jgi:predicted CopG family antitoxin
MASKTIMIQEGTYLKLLQLKKDNESFNDVISRLIYQAQELEPFYGMFDENQGNLIEEAINEARKANDLIDNQRENY